MGIINKYKGKIQFLLDKGLFHLFGSSCINQIISFAANIIIVRLLTKADYGIFGYASNLIGFYVLFSGLGSSTAILQYCSENRASEQKKAYVNFSIKYGLLSAIILSIIATFYALFSSLDIPDARNALILFSWFPVLNYLFDYCGIFLRAKQENKLYAFYTNLNSASNLCLTVILSSMFGVIGTILSKYLAFVFSVLLVIFKTDLIKTMTSNLKITFKEKVDFFKYGITILAGNVISELLYLLDVFFIGKILKSSEIIASYKLATLIPTALLFIPNNIILFVYPYFAKNLDNKEWVSKKYKDVLKILLIVNGIIAILLFIFAPLIIKILWGESYQDAVVPFRILAINYFVQGTFRSLTGNVLAMLRKVKINLVINIITGLFNIIFDIILIYQLGSNGAAYATLGVVVISSILYVGYFYKFYLKRSE